VLTAFVSLDPVAVGAQALIPDNVFPDVFQIRVPIPVALTISPAITVDMIDLKCPPIIKATTDALAAKQLKRLQTNIPLTFQLPVGCLAWVGCLPLLHVLYVTRTNRSMTIKVRGCDPRPRFG
jgi:hypothetical protein